jgi:hypothetical protein
MTDVSLRPNLGAGYSFERNHVEISGAETRETRSTAHGLVISPGIEALIPIGVFSLCIELRHDTVLIEGDDPSASVLGFGLALVL